MANEIFLVNSSSFQDVEISSALRAGPNSIVDLTQALTISGSFSGKGNLLTSVSSSYIIPSANATASYSLTTSLALNSILTISSSIASSSISSSYSNISDIANSISFVPETSISSSVASSSISSSYSNISTLSITSISSSWVSSSISSSVAISSSNIIPGATFYLVSGSDGYSPAYIEPYDLCPTTSLYRPPFKEGRLMWDHKYVDYSHYMDTNWRMHLGKEVTIGVRNPTNQTMSRLSPVYVSGSDELPDTYQPNVYLAIADGTGIKSNVIGIIRNDIPPGGTGFILMTGVMHRVNMGSYPVGQQLWLSPTVEGGLTTTRPGQPYEDVSIGFCSEAGETGSFICSIKEYPIPANSYAGMTSYPTITDNSSSYEVYITSGSVNLYNNTSGIGTIYGFSLSEVTFSIPPSTTASFVYATTNGITASYKLTNNFNDINGTNKVIVSTLYRADEDTHWIESNAEGLALANKLAIRLIETEKFAWESGFTLYETGSRQFVITEGQVWYGATNISQPEFDSRLTESVPKHETHFTYHSQSQWVIPIITNGTYNNSHYDNGTNLIPLSTDYYVVNYFFRILGANPFDEDVFIIPSAAEYVDLASAQNDTIPANIPGVLEDVSLLVGRIIIQSGSMTSSLIESAFANNFGQSLISQHNNLGGIQGGTGGQYYHMTLPEYTGTGTGVIVRKDGASLTNVILSGSLLGTSSWANTANIAKSIDFIPNTSTSASWASSSISSSYTITASFALNVIPTISSSWASSSISSSYSDVSNIAYSINFVPMFATSASWVSESNLINTASYAHTASYALNALPTISASWASASISSSYSEVSNIAYSINFVPTTAISASWISASVTINTASYALNALSSVSASYSDISNIAYSINFVPITATSASWISASVTINTASYAVTASNFIGFVANNIFSRGGTIYNSSYIPNATQWIYVWRSPFNCTASSINTLAETTLIGLLATASINVRKNHTDLLLTSSYSITGSGIYAQLTALQNNIFVQGDTLEIGLIGTTGSLTQVNIQVDFIR